MPESLGRKVLVLGCYGLIGEAVVGRLVRDGHQLTGLGRDIRDARRRWPTVGSISRSTRLRSLTSLRRCRAWSPDLCRLARQAALENTPLPAEEKRLFRIWFACGFPAFGAVLAILWLMVTRPEISF